MKRKRRNPEGFPTGEWVDVEKIRVNENGTIDVIVKDSELPRALLAPAEAINPRRGTRKKR